MEKIKDVLVVKELDKIKALSNVYRISIIEAFDNKPATAKIISVKLGEPHGKVNYHMKMLAKVGILKLVEISTKLGVVEKYYMPVAKNFIIDSNIIKKEGEEGINSLNKYTNALLNRISKDFYKSIENKELEGQRKILYYGEYYMTLEEAQELHKKFAEVADEFLKEKKEKREGTEKYTISSLVIPVDKD